MTAKQYLNKLRGMRKKYERDKLILDGMAKSDPDYETQWIECAEELVEVIKMGWKIDDKILYLLSNPRDWYILTAFYQDGLTAREIANKLGIKTATVQKAKVLALKKLETVYPDL